MRCSFEIVEARLVVGRESAAAKFGGANIVTMSPVYSEDARNGNSKFVENERTLRATYDSGKGEKIVAEKPPLKNRTNGTAPTAKSAKTVANGKRNGTADASPATGKKKIFTKGRHSFTIIVNSDN